MVDITKICCGCFAIALITLLVLLIISFSSLEINEYGLDYSAISKTVNVKPFIGGIHFLGVGHSFIKYPKTVQTIEFSEDRSANGPLIKSRTQDGLEVQLEISFQFKVIFDSLHKLYMTYGNNYKKVFEKMAVDVLTESATNYTAYDFFVDRMKIGAAMQDSLNQHFRNFSFSTIDFFQLRSVDLPDEFEKAIQMSEVKKQEIQKAYATKNSTIVELQTLKLTAEYYRNVTLNLAEGDAQAIMSQSLANAKSFSLVQQSNTKAYSRLKNNLKLDNPTLLNFIKAKIVRDYSGQNLIMSLDNMEKKPVV